MASQPIYQFYAELDDYEPKMWRRFQVSKTISLARLGYIVMTMFEMQASHLFGIDVMYRDNLYKQLSKSFSPAEAKEMLSDEEVEEIRHFTIRDEMTIDFDDVMVEDAAETRMSFLVSRRGDEMVLRYDYGDGWEVKIVLEEIFVDKELPGKELPRVLAGEGYGIIEDCGGTGGLEELAKVFKVRKGSRYKELSEWLGVADLDLNEFDLEDMNFRVKKIPRIYADIYQYGLEPTERSMEILTRAYKR